MVAGIDLSSNTTHCVGNRLFFPAQSQIPVPLSNFMNLQNVPGYHQNVVKGVIILLAVLLQTGFRGRAVQS